MNNVFDIGAVSRQLRTGGEPPDNADMEARVTKLEGIAEKTSAQLTALEKDVAVIKSNYTTKDDLSNLRSEMHREFNVQTWRIIGAMLTFGTLLTAVTYFIARNVK